jgi:hypothetical protein
VGCLPTTIMLLWLLRCPLCPNCGLPCDSSRRPALPAHHLHLLLLLLLLLCFLHLLQLLPLSLLLLLLLLLAIHQLLQLLRQPPPQHCLYHLFNINHRHAGTPCCRLQPRQLLQRSRHTVTTAAAIAATLTYSLLLLLLL